MLNFRATLTDHATMARRTSPSRTCARALARARLVCVVVVGTAIAASIGGSQAATSSVTVSLDVLSSTTLDASTCPASALTFGTVLPDSSQVAPAACTLVFGSSNDSSMLKMYQLDSTGDAMMSNTEGGMDTAFGPDGIRTIDFPEGNAHPKWGALQPDGQYVVLGSVTAGGDDDAGVARIGPTGTMDAAFGDGATGRKVHDFAPTFNETYRNGALQPDGKILGVGHVTVGGFDNAILVRFTDAGQMDGTFGGGDGLVEVDAGGWDQFWDVRYLPNGRIMAFGCACGIGDSKPLIARFDSNGALDPAFGTNGWIKPLTWGTWAEIQTAVVLANGAFIVGGVRDAGAGKRAFVARLHADGSLDTSYGMSGFRDIAWSGAVVGIGRITLASPDGAVWVSGHDDIGGGTINVGAARVTAAGNLDTGWNGTGTATAGYGAGQAAYGYASLPVDGSRMLAVGGVSGDYHALMFTNGGSAELDTSFSTDGKHTIDFAGAADFGVGPFAGREGKVVIPGTATTGGVARFGIAVFAGGTTIPDYGGAAVFGSANTQAAFGACLEARSGAGVTGGWALDAGGACTAVVGDPWNGIADTVASPSAKVLGSPTSGVTNATATIRFGIKTALATPPRNFAAPIAVEVIAPNA